MIYLKKQKPNYMQWVLIKTLNPIDGDPFFVARLMRDGYEYFECKAGNGCRPIEFYAEFVTHWQELPKDNEK